MKPKPEHDFRLKRDEWVKVLFNNADHFVVWRRGDDIGQRERHDFKTFEEAITLAKTSREYMVNVVTKSGRWENLNVDGLDYDQLIAYWNAKKSKPA